MSTQNPLAAAPGQEQSDRIELHPVQLGDGVLSYFRDFHRAVTSHKLIESVISGDKLMPILVAEAELGDPPVQLQFDLNQIFRDADGPEAQEARRQDMLYLWNNYYVKESAKHIQMLLQMAHNAYTAFFNTDPSEAGVREDLARATSFDDKHQLLCEAVKTYAVPWKCYSQAMKQESTQKLAGEAREVVLSLDGGIQVSLADILNLAHVQDQAVIGEVAGRLQEHRHKNLVIEFEAPLREVVFLSKTLHEIACQAMNGH